MIRLIPLLFMLTACSATYQKADQLASIHIIDQNGFSESVTDETRLKKYSEVDYLKPQSYQQVSRIYHPDKEGNNRATLTSYYPNGQVKQCLEVENSRAKGSYKEWHENGRLKIDAHVVGGVGELSEKAQASWLFDGESVAFSSEGQKEGVITYRKGKLHGTAYHYHSNGTIWKETPYQSGKQHGTEKVFLANGTMLLKAEFRNGTPSGKTLRYWSNHQLASDESFQNGRLMEATYWDRQSNEVSRISKGYGVKTLFGQERPVEQHQYQNGIQKGVVKLFDEEQRLAQQFMIENGVKNGEEQLFYPASGRPKLSIHWVDGLINGEVKSWYPNQTLESRREMSKNRRHGLSTAWYQDGSVMLIEEYDFDRLTRGEYRRKGSVSVASRVTAGNGVATLFDGNGLFLEKIRYEEGEPIR